MNKTLWAVAALAGATLAPLPALAHTDLSVGINLGGPAYYAEPVPPPIVYQPAPVYVEPAPSYYYGYGPPVVYGPGPHYWHHRHWREHEWRERHWRHDD